MSILFFVISVYKYAFSCLNKKGGDEMALGKRLKQILDEKGVTVKDFAAKIGVPATTLYSFIQRDSSTGKLDLLAKICQGLDIDLSDLFDFSSEKEIDPTSDEYKSDLEYVKSLSCFNDTTWNQDQIETFAKFILSLDENGLRNLNEFIRILSMQK